MGGDNTSKPFYPQFLLSPERLVINRHPRPLDLGPQPWTKDRSNVSTVLLFGGRQMCAIRQMAHYQSLRVLAHTYVTHACVAFICLLIDGFCLKSTYLGRRRPVNPGHSQITAPAAVLTVISRHTTLILAPVLRKSLYRKATYSNERLPKYRYAGLRELQATFRGAEAIS
jgi:hypothetical protein